MKRNALMEECRKLITSEIRDEIDFSVSIVNRIFDILEQNNITQREFAKRMGKNEAEISRWMQGTHNFTLTTIKKIEKALGEPVLVVAGSVKPEIHNKTILVKAPVTIAEGRQTYSPGLNSVVLPVNPFFYLKNNNQC